MTINQALARCSRALGNTVSEDTVLGWLFEIENTVTAEIAQTHENTEIPAPASDFFTDRDRLLFVSDPYSELYISYVIMKNDLRLRDMQRYINSAAVFSSEYSSFADFFNRRNAPLGQKKIIL